MTADDYLTGIINKYAVNEAGAIQAGKQIIPIIEKWASGYLVRAEFSGSLSKGTAISIGTDADIFLSLSSTTPGTLQNIYNTLCNALETAQYPVRRQNVSIGTMVNGYSIDLVPARRQSQHGNDHSLYRRKTQTWTLTNVHTHISHVYGSGRIEEIKLAKIWRCLHGLDFPSFHLELAVIDALYNQRTGRLSNNFLTVLEYFRDRIPYVRLVDPANTNNVVSSDLSDAEKDIISRQAAISLQKPNWNQIVW